MDTISTIKHQVLLSQWTERVRDCQTSGMTVQDWCNANNIGIKSYYYWLKRVRELTLNNLQQADTNTAIAECRQVLPLAESSDNISFKRLEVQSQMPGVQAAVTIRLPQASIEVTNDASQRTLEAVLLALKSV